MAGDRRSLILQLSRLAVGALSLAMLGVLCIGIVNPELVIRAANCCNSWVVNGLTGEILSLKAHKAYPTKHGSEFLAQFEAANLTILFALGCLMLFFLAVLNAYELVHKRKRFRLQSDVEGRGLSTIVYEAFFSSNGYMFGVRPFRTSQDGDRNIDSVDASDLLRAYLESTRAKKGMFFEFLIIPLGWFFVVGKFSTVFITAFFDLMLIHSFILICGKSFVVCYAWVRKAI